MKRAELLQQTLTEEKNVDVLVSSVESDDKKFLKRRKRNLEDQIEDLEEELRNRLSSKEPLEQATVEVTYQAIKTKKDVLDLYKQFEKEHIAA